MVNAEQLDNEIKNYEKELAATAEELTENSQASQQDTRIRSHKTSKLAKGNFGEPKDIRTLKTKLGQEENAFAKELTQQTVQTFGLSQDEESEVYGIFKAIAEAYNPFRAPDSPIPTFNKGGNFARPDKNTLEKAFNELAEITGNKDIARFMEQELERIYS